MAECSYCGEEFDGEPIEDCNGMIYCCEDCMEDSEDDG